MIRFVWSLDFPGKLRASAWRLGVVVGLAVWLAAGSTSNAATTGAAPPSAALNVQLKSAMNEAVKRLGTLEPWQKKIFDDEALAQPQRFMRDYRQTSNGLVADIDIDSLKSFLRFYGPTLLKRENPPVVVYLAPEPGCARCAAATAEMKGMVTTRLERRGMTPVFATPADLGMGGKGAKTTDLKDKALVEALARVAEARKAAGSLLVQWRNAEPEADDSAHADEIQYSVFTSASFRDYGRQEGRLEIFEGGSFEATASKLLTDAFTELGRQAESGQIQTARAIEMDRDPVTIDVGGVGDYAQYTQLKSELQAKLKSVGPVEDHRLARGHAVFAIYTDKSGEELRAQLGGIKLDHGSVSVTGAAKGSVQLEVSK